MILKWILEWKDNNKWWHLVNTEMKCRIAKKKISQVAEPSECKNLQIF